MASSVTPRSTILVKDFHGYQWVVDMRSGETYRVGKTDSSQRVTRAIWGKPVTSIWALPVKFRRKHWEMFGRSDTRIRLAPQLGFKNTGRSINKEFSQNYSHGLERYLAGHIPNPFDGRMNPKPQDYGIFRADGQVLATDDIEDARDYLRLMLEPYGLNQDELIRLLDDAIIAGKSDAQIWAALRTTDQYKERFKGNEMRRKEGLRELSAQEYVAMEDSMRDVMARAGLPSGFYDEPDDFANWIGTGLGPQLLADRINRGVRQVVTASDEVKQSLSDLLPISGEQALLSYMLDPDRATTMLENMVMRAQAEGRFAEEGIDLDSEVRDQAANRAQQLGMSIEEQQAQLEQGLAAVRQDAGLFRETVSEGTDMTQGGTGARATLVGDVDAAMALERRRKARQATGGGAGGASLTQKGTALGSAD